MFAGWPVTHVDPEMLSSDEVRRVLIAVDRHGRSHACRPGNTPGASPSTLLATAAGWRATRSACPPSKGAVVPLKLLPIALTRSLKAAVLLVPSVIAGDADRAAAEARRAGVDAVRRVDERPGGRAVPDGRPGVAAVVAVRRRARVGHVIVVAVGAGQPVLVRRAEEPGDHPVLRRGVGRVIVRHGGQADGLRVDEVDRVVDRPLLDVRQAAACAPTTRSTTAHRPRAAH